MTHLFTKLSFSCIIRLFEIFNAKLCLCLISVYTLLLSFKVCNSYLFILNKYKVYLWALACINQMNDKVSILIHILICKWLNGGNYI